MNFFEVCFFLPEKIFLFQDKATDDEKVIASMFFLDKWHGGWFSNTNISWAVSEEVVSSYVFPSVSNHKLPSILGKDNSPVQRHLLLIIHVPGTMQMS